jgi:zinc transporter 1
MHILVKSHTEFAACSQSVRKVLHRFGVHSTTIQPELLDLTSPSTQNAVATIMSRQGSMERLNGSNGGPGNLVIIDGDDDDGVGCMAQCVEDSCIDR